MMSWLRRRLAKPAPTVPLAPEETLSQRCNRLKEEALIEGGGTLHGWSNVAPGTPGYGFVSLAREGLMKSDRRLTEAGVVWDYTLTDVGRSARSILAL